jgi:hypothetical protein
MTALLPILRKLLLFNMQNVELMTCAPLELLWSQLEEGKRPEAEISLPPRVLAKRRSLLQAQAVIVCFLC